MTQRGNFHPRKDAEERIPARLAGDRGEAVCDLLGNTALFLGLVHGEENRLLKIYLTLWHNLWAGKDCRMVSAVPSLLPAAWMLKEKHRPSPCVES